MWGRESYDSPVVDQAGGERMAIEDLELNLFTSDPTLLERGSDEEYERAAQALERLADPRRLRLLHALSLGEETPQRAAVWAGVEQGYAERELQMLALSGVVERRERLRDGKTYVYRPAFTRAEHRARLSRDLARGLVAEFGDAALAAFSAELDTVDASHRAALRRVAQKDSRGSR